MTMTFLKQLAGSRLPMTFYRTDDIDQVRLLRAAGLVVAMVPSPADAASRTPCVAQVLAITQRGQEELARFSLPEARSRWRMRMPRIKSFAWSRLLSRPRDSQQSPRLH